MTDFSSSRQAVRRRGALALLLLLFGCALSSSEPEAAPAAAPGPAAVRDALRVFPVEDTELQSDDEGGFGSARAEYGLRNGGSAAIKWRAACEAKWIVLSAESGVLKPGETTTLEITVDTLVLPQLEPGEHYASISLSSTADVGKSIVRRVMIAFGGASELTVSEYEGGAFTLRNEGERPIPWRALPAEPWLYLSPEDGELAPGGTAKVRVDLDERLKNSVGRKRLHTRAGVGFVNLASGVGTTMRALELSEDRTRVAAPAAVDTRRAKSLTRFGIRWTFDREYEVGTFANGDPWVVGPVFIVDITPGSRAQRGRTINGSMINPSPKRGMSQGYDSAMYDKYKEEGSYDPTLNVALGASRRSPLVVKTHSSLVSTISVPGNGARPQIDTAAILTVLERAAPEGAFRPPYSGYDKGIDFTVENLDRSKLASLKPVGSTPPLRQFERKFERPWLDHVSGWFGRYLHPASSMPDYGREMTDEISTAALLLHLDFPLERKEKLLVRFVQLGIDFYGVLLDGGTWPPSAGHLNGRKWPILFAGLMLDDPAMKSIGADYGPTVFSEDGQTFYVESANPDQGYTQAHIGMAEWGTSHTTRPELDDVRWFHTEPFPPGASRVELRTQSVKYRLCCTANTFWGELLAAYIMDAKELWNHPPLFDYQDRFFRINNEHNITDYRNNWSRFPIDMWREYRGRFR